MLSASKEGHSAGLISPTKPQGRVGQGSSVSHRNSYSQACWFSTAAARPLDISQNPNGTLGKGNSNVLWRDSPCKEAEPAKISREVFKAFPKLFSNYFQTNNAFIKPMPSCCETLLITFCNTL